MVRITNTRTVHHCPKDNGEDGPCRKPKGELYCHAHSMPCPKHPDIAHLKDAPCPTCVIQEKLIKQKEMKVREKGKDPVGDMKKRKQEAAAANKKNKR